MNKQPLPEQTTAARRFVEDAIGEKILLEGRGSCLSAPLDLLLPVTGLFFLSATRFVFAPWPKHRERLFTLPRAGISGLEVLPESVGLLRRLFNPQPPQILLRYSDERGRSGSVRFSMEHGHEEFLDGLRLGSLLS